MKKFLLILFISSGCIVAGFGQTYIPQVSHRYYYNDTTKMLPKKPWVAVAEVFGLNLGVWTFDRYIMHEDWSYINWKTIKHNFRKGPIWDTDQFMTNLFSHPYHGSLYFNASRSNGLNFWQSIPFAAGGSLMWEFFMENEPPSINDMMATTFGGIELGEITYRLSDIFIDDRSTGTERIGREILAGIFSPVRAFNRVITGRAWKWQPIKGRAFESTPVNFVISVGPRFLAELDDSNNATTSLHVNLRINYGYPYDDDLYSPYEWFRFNFGMDFFSAQPLINQANAIGVLWGKQIWQKEEQTLSFGLFQHFDFYNSELRHKKGKRILPPYRIAAPASVGGGLLYRRVGTPADKTDIYADLYVNGVALGASMSDYMLLDERDYNLGSGYSLKASASITWNKKIAFLMDMENYHIFTWKGYKPDTDWIKIDPENFNVQGDAGNARLTIFTAKLAYYIKERWNIMLTNRYFNRRTNYRYFSTEESSTYDLMLTLGYRL